MRKGMTLIEIIVIIVVLPVFMLAFDKMFRTVVKDAPRSYRVVNENISLLNMLEKLQQDIDVAKGLPSTYGSYSVSDEQFLIEQDDCVICYRFEGSEVLRYRLTDNSSSNEGSENSWRLPHTVIQWLKHDFDIIDGEFFFYALNDTVSSLTVSRAKHIDKKNPLSFR